MKPAHTPRALRNHIARSEALEVRAYPASLVTPAPPTDLTESDLTAETAAAPAVSAEQFDQLIRQDFAPPEASGPSAAAAPLTYDFDGNGKFDLADFNFFRLNFGKRGPNLLGDANKDGVVDLRDLVLLRQALSAATLRVQLFFADKSRILQPLNSMDVQFSTRLTEFPLAALQLDAAADNKGNLLTTENTPIRKLGVNGAWDGLTWSIPKLWQPTLRAGAYTLTIQLDLLKIESASVLLPSIPSLQRTFVRTTEIPSSDNMMRMISSTSEVYWDHARYSNFDLEDGAATIAMSTFIRYAADLPYPYDATSDPVRGFSRVPGRESASSAYNRLYEVYKSEHPTTVVAGYISWQSVMSTSSMLKEGLWPSDSTWIGEFFLRDILEPLPTSVGTDGRVNLETPQAQEMLFQAHLETALGLNGRPRNDMIHFDEVGYVYDQWETTAKLLERLRNALADHGVLVSINLGGWGWVAPFGFGPNVLQQLPKMADAVGIENIWNRDINNGVSFRSPASTRAIIANLRSVLAQGTAINLFPTDYDTNANFHSVTSIREVETTPYIVNNNNPLLENPTTALRITTSAPHHIFPLGGVAFELFRLEGLPPELARLPSKGWTAVAVPGQPNQVDLYNRNTRLEDIKRTAGITGAINYRATAGSNVVLADGQAIRRLLASLVMMTRNPGDKISISYSPGQSMPGGGGHTNSENWIYWPQQYGDPVGDYVIDSVNSQTGLITKMHRDFEGGRIEVYPEAGYVVSLPKRIAASTPNPLGDAGIALAVNATLNGDNKESDAGAVRQDVSIGTQGEPSIAPSGAMESGGVGLRSFLGSRAPSLAGPVAEQGVEMNLSLAHIGVALEQLDDEDLV